MSFKFCTLTLNKYINKNQAKLLLEVVSLFKIKCSDKKSRGIWQFSAVTEVPPPFLHSLIKKMEKELHKKQTHIKVKNIYIYKNCYAKFQ